MTVIRSANIAQPNSGNDGPQPMLDLVEVAARLAVAQATLKGWLADDQERPAPDRVFDFHRWRGRNRKWTEEGFQHLEAAIHRESQIGVLARWRTREKSNMDSPPDPDAEAAMREVLGEDSDKTY